MAGQVLGQNCHVGFAGESTWGTFVVPTKWLRPLDESLAYDCKRLTKPALGGNSLARHVLGKRGVGGGFSFHTGITGWELLAKHAFGAVVDAGVGPYTHTFTLADALPAGLSVEVNRDSVAAGNVFTYAGCQVNKLVLKCAPEELLTATVELLGKVEATGTLTAATFPTFTPLDYSHLVACSINSVSYAAHVKNLEFTLENNLAADRYGLGAVTRRGLGRGAPRRISLKLELDFTDALLAARTLYTGLNTTGYAVALQFTNSPAILDITLANTRLIAMSDNIKGPGPATMTLELEAAGTTEAANDEVTMVMTNSTAGPT